MTLISIGVKSIKRGPIPNDGTMGTVLSKLGDTYKDSASFKEDQQSVFNVEVEESDDPVLQSFTKGGKKLMFSLVDYTPGIIQLVKGGSVVNDEWEEPDTVPIIEESYQVITQTGLLLEFPRMSIAATFNAELKKAGVALLDVVGTPLKPTGAVKSVKISKYKNPTVSAGNAQNITVNNASLVGTATAYRGTNNTYKWEVDTKPAGATPVFSAAAALNTNVTGLTVDGVYKFKLTVTDENGFENSATVTVTVALA